MAEYLEALTAERLIDAETSALVCTAYHRLHYGSGDADAVEVRQASERLRDSVVAIGAISDESRNLIAERIRQRLSIAAWGEGPPLRQDEKESTDFVPRFDPVGGPSSDHTGEQSLPDDHLNQDAESKLSGRRREIRINSIPLETATLVVVGLVVGGYILRGGTDQAIAPGGLDAGGSKRAKVVAADVWKHEDYWAANLRRRAQTEAARKREQSARLGFELLISEMPKDAGALNDLAWLYLTSDDLSLRNPQRGLDLALRALAISRAPAILDTAAEARYQTGRADEAVKLEQEALDSLPRYAGFQETQFLATLRRQLEKFQSAAKSNSSEASSPAS
jgi:tetratricopeptide (TPR) repeat protein